MMYFNGPLRMITHVGVYIDRLEWELNKRDLSGTIRFEFTEKFKRSPYYMGGLYAMDRLKEKETAVSLETLSILVYADIMQEEIHLVTGI
jgi:hypothetical protein